MQMSSHEKQKELSKKWLADSFIELIQTKPYEDITVSEISANADLARRTFYRVFGSKNELICYIIENLVHEYIIDLQTTENITMEKLTLIFFGFFEKHKNLIEIFKCNHLEYFILESFNKYLPTIRVSACKNKMSDNPEIDKMFMLISGGGFFNLLMYWTESNSDITPKELSQLVPKAVKLFASYL